VKATLTPRRVITWFRETDVSQNHAHVCASAGAQIGYTHLMFSSLILSWRLCAATSEAEKGSFLRRDTFFTSSATLSCDATRVSAIDAIGAIALCPAALPHASACIAAVMHSLRHHEGGDVAEAACKTLGIFLRSPVTRERAVQAGAEAAVQAGARAAQHVAPSVRSAEDSDDD